MIDLEFHGLRAVSPTAGPAYGRHGGNTRCCAAEVSPRHYLVVGAGTGLRRLEERLPPGGGLAFTVVLTHYHWASLQGLASFRPLDDRTNRFTFVGPRRGDMDVADVLDGAFRPPWFATRLRERPAGTVCAGLEGPLDAGPVHLTPFGLRHPLGSTGLRLDGPRRSVVLALDHGAGDPGVDAALVAAADRTDVLVHDAGVTEREAADGERSLGRSTWADAVTAALACRAGRLVLAGHDPRRTDDGIEDLVREARRRFPLVSAGFEGLRLPL